MASLQIDAQIESIIDEVIKNSGTAYGYSWDKDGVTTFNYKGLVFSNNYYKTAYLDYDQVLVGAPLTEKSVHKAQLWDLHWEALESIEESHPSYLNESLLTLKVSFSIEFGYRIYRDGDASKDYSMKELYFFVKKSNAEALKKSLLALSDYAKKQENGSVNIVTEKETGKKETIKLIESILNEYSAGWGKREYSIKDDKMIINNVTLEYYQYYENIHWDQLEFKGTAKYKEKDGYVYLGFDITYNYYEKFSSNDEQVIKYGDYILFAIREDKVDALKNAFLRLKEIYK